MEQSRFLQLYLPIRGQIRAFVHSATRNLHDTDDLCQQVGGVLWSKIDRFDGDRPFIAWAIGIARMEVLKWRDRTRRNAKVALLSEEAIAALAKASSDSTEVPEANDRSLALQDCIRRLATKTREVVQMKYRDGLAIKLIAEALNREIGAVEMTLVRARRALRECIEDKVKSNDLSDASKR